MPNKSKIIITVGCRNLPEISGSAYRVVMDIGFEGFSHHKDTLKTEAVRGTNPSFQNQLTVDYVFEEKQLIIATIILINGSEEIVFGKCSATIGRLVHSGGSSELPIQVLDERNQSTKQSYFIVHLQEDTQKKENFQLKMNATDLDKKDLFGKSDPYLILFKKSDKGKWTKTYRTEMIKSNLNPYWKPLPICLHKLCDNNFQNEILVRCFDWDGADGDPEDMDSDFDEIIGECYFTCQHLLDAPNNLLSLELINFKKQKKKRGYLHSGKLHIQADMTLRNHSFLDYMFSGIDLNFIVAVDLSVPKLNVEDQIESIRLFNVSRQANEYEVAIKAVIEILQEYDTDNQFPAFGFGSQTPPDFKECHEYPLNGDFQNPFCRGVKGVLKAYQIALQTVKPLNSANFSPVIHQVNRLARQHCDSKHYFILLILTNGAVEDWTETKKAVIEASTLPVSIIVVGIGSGNFADMKTLDQDQGLLRVGPDRALRDNVQFVPMRKFLRMAADGSRSIKWNKVALAKEVLAELPDQLVAYMNQNQVIPSLTVSSHKSIVHSSTDEQVSSDTECDQQQQHQQQTKQLRRCVTAHVNIRPSSSSERDRRRGDNNAPNANFFNSNRSSLRKTSIDGSYKKPK